MSVFNIKILPFDDVGNYLNEFVDVTQDVKFNSLGNLTRKIDNDDFNVGVFRFNSFPLVLKNNLGRYSEPGELESIFRFRRTDSIVRITWDINPFPLIAGSAVSSESFTLDEPVVVFEGLLSDKSFETEINEQDANFTVLGFESKFEEVAFPFDSASNGMTFKELILLALDLPEITSLLTLDADNINPDLNLTWDDIDSFENKTSKQVLDEVLAASNSVLYIEDRVIYVSDRSSTNELQDTFTGQAALFGAEDVQNIESFRSGINRTFNLWTWRDTSLFARDTSSIDIYGVLRKEIDYRGITNNSTRQAILNRLRDVWSFPKREFLLSTPLNFKRLQRTFFDLISVDYPPVFFQKEDLDLPVYNVSKYDEATYPEVSWSLVIDPSERFKILGKTLNLKNQIIEFNMRGI